MKMSGVRRGLERLWGGKSTPAPATVRKWNLAAAAVLGAEGLAIALLSGTLTLPVYVSFVTQDSLQTKLHGAPVLAPAIHELTQINLASMLAVLLFAVAIVYALSASVWRRRYEAWLKRRVQPLRWAIVGVGGAAVLCLLALIVGVRQLDSLKMIAVLMIIAALGAWQLELQAGQKRISTVAWLSLAVTILAAVAAWLVILLTLVADGIFGSAAVSAWTWWLVATTFICWLAFAVNAHLHRFGFGKWANYTYTECWAVAIIVLTLSVFAWQLFAAVLKP